MNVKIIPAINVTTQKDFEEQLRAVETEADIVQIDISDGKFTNWQSWADAEEIKKIATNSEYELHLMVENPQIFLRQWESVPNLRRVIVQAESFDKINLELFHNLSDYGFELCFALNPNTNIEILNPILPNLEYVLLLGVTPGKSGQKFQEKTLSKITALKTAHPHLKIEVDGGINEGNIEEIISAGADILCMGSAIFNDIAPPAENLKMFKELIKLKSSQSV